ncbi:MAG: L-methionine/branched-chain amino acid transporter [Plesiomonas sp.]|uniref:L-methionine/branched-chain amino acid transporter n=1 Tax=Plesiomonas sp. TaxID=2486279 RepID=UPI003F3BB91F
MKTTSGLKPELGVLQGIGLLATSLLGTGVFAVPALAVTLVGTGVLWLWPLLIMLVFPIAIGFAALGRAYPHAGGTVHFVELAFGAYLARATGWLFLLVIPVGLPAALQIAAGFWIAAFGFNPQQALGIELLTLLVVLGFGMRSAGSSANIQTLIALLIVAVVILISYYGQIWQNLTFPAWPKYQPLSAGLAVMFWCFVGLEAFAHLGSEFRQPARDFPRALLGGLLLAGSVYWACTLAILHFQVYDLTLAPSASIPTIVGGLLGKTAQQIACLIGYLACFASINIYLQSFARLVWSQTRQYTPHHRIAQLSVHQVPSHALLWVVGICALCTVIIYGVNLSLSSLIIYANAIFVLIYLLAMLSGVVLLRGMARIMSLIGALLCSIFLFWIIGIQSSYALLLLLLCYVIAKILPSYST